MTRDCPHRDELLQFVNGELAQNRASTVDKHVDGCERCQRQVDEWTHLVSSVGMDIPGAEPDRVASSVMARIRSGARATQPRPSWQNWWFASATVAAAGLVLFVTLGSSDKPLEESGTFQARSGQKLSALKQAVGVRFHAVREGELVPILPESVLRPDTQLTISYVNAIEERPVYLLSFAIDSEATFHWIDPAYTDEATNPKAIKLDVSREDEVARPESVQFDGVAPGELQLVWISAHSPMTVSDVEGLAKSERNAKAMQARWADSDVAVVSVQWGE